MELSKINGTFIIIDVTKDYLESNQNYAYEKSLKIHAVWTCESRKEIIGGTNKYFSLGKHLLK